MMMGDTAAARQLAHLREQFAASLTPEQRALNMELDSLESDAAQWWSEQFEAEAVRHLPGLGPLVRMFLQHLHEGQDLTRLGQCCRSPEEEAAEYDG